MDHLQPVKSILFLKFYNFFTFILEANSYYPRGLILRKGNSPNKRNGPDRGFSVPGTFKLEHLQPVKPILFRNFSNFWLWYLKLTAYGIQTGPFVACWANFVWKFFHLFILILGSQCLWHSNLTICSMLSQFCSEMFQTFDFDTWSSLPIAFKLDHL